MVSPPSGTDAMLAALAGSPGRGAPPSLAGASLLLLDLQRLFVDPGSPAWLSGWGAAAPRCAALLEAFRAAGRPVIFTRHREPEGRESLVIGHFGGRPLRAEDPLAALAAPWRPLPGERLLDKARYSAWWGTGLEALVPPGAPLVIAGVTTHRCVLAAAVEAASRDRLPVVAADACATRGAELQLASLRVIAHGFGHVASVEEVLRAL
jgi:nicotinamidase-related amidase